MMTHQIMTGQRVKLLRNPFATYNALLAILDRAFIKIVKFIKELGKGRCPWLHYELPDGRRLATFISPKAFQGYWWNEDFTETVNKATGAKYRVSDRHCTCKSWEYHVKRRKRKTCKHQRMRQLEILRHKFPVVNLSDSLPTKGNGEWGVGSRKFSPKSNSNASSSKNFKNLINRNTTPDLRLPTPLDRIQLKPGLTLEKIKDSTKVGYYLKAWHKNNPLSTPSLKKIGEIFPSGRGFEVSTIGQKTKLLVSQIEKAIDSILKQINVTYFSVNEAFIEAINLSRSTA